MQEVTLMNIVGNYLFWMIEDTVMYILELLGWALVRGECLLDRGWPLIKVLSFFTCHTLSVSLLSINQKI